MCFVADCLFFPGSATFKARFVASSLFLPDLATYRACFCGRPSFHLWPSLLSPVSDHSFLVSEQFFDQVHLKSKYAFDLLVGCIVIVFHSFGHFDLLVRVQVAWILDSVFFCA